MASSLVRAGRRLSDMMMNAPWTVAHVERPNLAPPSPAASQKLREALKLAEQLGAVTVALTGDDLVDSVLDYARRNNLTQIVVGKPQRRGLPFRRNLLNSLLQYTRGAAFHVIT